MRKELEKMYFDYNAAGLIDVDFIQDLTGVLKNYGNFFGANPSSAHRLGREMQGILDQCRFDILDEFESQDPGAYGVLLTSGATESNNMVLKGFDGSILLSSVEHASSLSARDDMECLPVDSQGVIDLDFLEKRLQHYAFSKDSHQRCLVSVMYANNETGAYQPVRDIQALCRKYNAWFHSDIVQIFGKEKIVLDQFDVVSISGHKLCGFQGFGALVYKKDFPLKPFIVGGGQQMRLRAGTENILGALSLSKGIARAKEWRSLGGWEVTQKLRDGFEDFVLRLSPKTQIFSKDVKRLPNTSMLTMPNISSEKQVMMFDLEGVCVSAGAACSSGVIQESHVLKAMGVASPVSKTAIRISMGPQTTTESVENLKHIWKKIFDHYCVV